MLYLQAIKMCTKVLLKGDPSNLAIWHEQQQNETVTHMKEFAREVLSSICSL